MSIYKPKINLPGHTDRCTGHHEAHIVHLVDRPGYYRLAFRCGCGKSKRWGRYVYKRVIAAERAIRNKTVDELFPLLDGR